MLQTRKTRIYVENFYDTILRYTRLWLAKMYKKEIAITHNFYLKQFQLANPKLHYDCLLFDEGQDASPAMLSVFLQQEHATKIIVGDTHQQIYGWRHAVNSLEQVDFPNFQLSNSFRFDTETASLAMQYLSWKNLFMEYKPMYINGLGSNSELKTRATLARSNLGLLAQAIDIVFKREEINKLYFEGNINSYTYAEEGASVYDVLHLYNGRRANIRDKLIKSMNDFEELEEYIEKTGDMTLGILVDVVEKYGNDLPYYLQRLKAFHVTDDKREEADMIFSTVHRCKGMEYDEVTLANDFVNEAKINKMLEQAKADKQPIDTGKLSEEVNLLYVAVTRSRNQLHIPIELRPPNRKINWIEATPASREKYDDYNFTFSYDEEKYQKYKKNKKNDGTLEKRWKSAKSSIKRANKGKKWSLTEDAHLLHLHQEGKSMSDLVEYFKRSEYAIQARLRRLVGEDLYF